MSYNDIKNRKLIAFESSIYFQMACLERKDRLETPSDKAKSPSPVNAYQLREAMQVPSTFVARWKSLFFSPIHTFSPARKHTEV